ncbi:murein L,D-transpeptidase catalytic domain family protein [Porphyromonadaceae bacterium W3.11]|nr:murein L,D-transpeptidase catalytic domain family protein [Porphyromonadaceae bacterium W3.11]
MFRKVLLGFIAVCIAALSPSRTEASREVGAIYLNDSVVVEGALYATLKLNDVVGFDAFRTALRGYNKIEEKGREVLTLIDFSKPSTEERMVVIDMAHQRVLCKSLVAHGRNSGDMMATRFSNKEGSYMSSLGFFLTGGTYNGSNGYSLKLYGLEKGVNDLAYKRAIVMHGADYCDPSVVAGGHRLGRSLGCPAVPRQLAKEVIDTIKDGSVLFIYAKDQWYQSHSAILKDA